MKTSRVVALTLLGLTLMGSAYAAGTKADLTTINSKYMITPGEALDWAAFKTQLGPTYGGTVAADEWINFIETTAQEFGLIDLVTQDMPYPHYIVNDWPDPETHVYGSGREVEKFISNGTPVPVVASYGMTSGSTPPTGVTAPMLYYNPASPPTKAEITGKILVFQTVPYPPAPVANGPYDYSSSVLGSYAVTDEEYQTPGTWYTPFVPVPADVSSSYHSRYVWSQLNGFATIAMNGGQATAAAGAIVVYDYSPAAAFGLIQRSVYSLTGSGGPGTVYENVPTLTLDRVNGAKVITDAMAGKSATLTLNAAFVNQTSVWVLGYLPGKDYGTPQDEQLLLATHTDAMSLVEEDGSFGMLGIMYYMNHIPQAKRPKTLVFWFDSRHFLPGAEGAWSAYDYYLENPELLAPIEATMGMEHMGGISTVEKGADGNNYALSTAGPNAGGLIASFIDLNNNNQWLINAVTTAAQDVNWPRVAASTGPVAPGAYYGGYQRQVLSPVNKGRSYTPQIPGIGLAGDWPGAWTQSYSQLNTEAGLGALNTPKATTELGTEGGAIGFDPNYFVTQVAGLSEIAGKMMVQENLKITLDLNWGALASGLTCTISAICTTAPVTGLLPNSGFVNPALAATQRATLVSQLNKVQTDVAKEKYTAAVQELQALEANINNWISNPNQTALDILIGDQITKLVPLGG
jgi:hypothetical protein